MLIYEVYDISLTYEAYILPDKHKKKTVIFLQSFLMYLPYQPSVTYVPYIAYDIYIIVRQEYIQQDHTHPNTIYHPYHQYNSIQSVHRCLI